MTKIAASVSSGKAAYKHDIRQSIKGNVTTALSKDNITLIDKLQGESIESYTDRKMAPWIEEYNKKQKKKCRRIEGTYTEWHNSNKQLGKSQLVYETVYQAGEHDTLGRQYYEAQGQEREELKQFFTELYTNAVKNFQQQYQHLEILWATIHFDEENGTPHLHLAFQPQGTFEKQGLSHKISIGRALEQDGIMRVKDKKEAMELGGYQLTKFYRQEKRALEQQLTARGFTLKQEQHGKKHQTVEEWEALQELKQQQEKAAKTLAETKQNTKAYIDYSQKMEELQEVINRPAYDATEVKTVTTGTFKKQQVVQMTQENFDALRSGADARLIRTQVEQTAKKAEKAAEQLAQSLVTDKDLQYQEQIHNLELKLSHAQDQIKEKDREINRLQKLLEEVKEFFKQFNIIQRFRDWHEKRQAQEHEFYFEGERKHE